MINGYELSIDEGLALLEASTDWELDAARTVSSIIAGDRGPFEEVKIRPSRTGLSFGVHVLWPLGIISRFIEAEKLFFVLDVEKTRLELCTMASAFESESPSYYIAHRGDTPEPKMLFTFVSSSAQVFHHVSEKRSQLRREQRTIHRDTSARSVYAERGVQERYFSMLWEMLTNTTIEEIRAEPSAVLLSLGSGQNVRISLDTRGDMPIMTIRAKGRTLRFQQKESSEMLANAQPAEREGLDGSLFDADQNNALLQVAAPFMCGLNIYDVMCRPQHMTVLFDRDHGKAVQFFASALPGEEKIRLFVNVGGYFFYL